jgi:Tol biopolymer transport system component
MRFENVLPFRVFQRVERKNVKFPVWSPDSKSVGFFADGTLKRIDIAGGALRTLATAAVRGGTWNADGVILFAPTTSSALFRLTASGAQGAVTKLDQQMGHKFPFFLPDGRQFLYFAQGSAETGGIYLGSLESGKTKRLTPADTRGVYLPWPLEKIGGWLVWVRAGTLVAQRLDLDEKALTGDQVTLADPVAFDTNFNMGAVSVSATGLVAYRTGAGNPRQLTWFDRAGKPLGPLGGPDKNDLRTPSISSDGRVAVARTVQGNTDIWLLDGTHLIRFTFDEAQDRSPIWSPDGRQIVFDSDRKGQLHRDLYRSSGVGAEELLLDSTQRLVPTDWSANDHVLYFSRDPQTEVDIWVLPLTGDRKGTPWTFLKTNSNFAERAARFSPPDGHWVAYQSNESGRFEIYIRPFIAPAASGARGNAAAANMQFSVSTEGGIHPVWRHDGKELYYVGPNGEMMAARITTTGTTLQRGTPEKLFPTRIFGGGVDIGQGRQYDVDKNNRFLINTVLDEGSAPITLIQNWKPPAK